MTTRIAALAATTAVAVAGFAPAASMAKATQPGKHTVKHTAYVYVKPGILFTGTMFKGNTFKIERISKSGKLAYGMAYGHVNRHAWIFTKDLNGK
jgi:hypothetical protein